MKHITYIDGGVWVRFTVNGKCYLQQSFFYSQHKDNVDATLRAAKKWRDSKLQSHQQVIQFGNKRQLPHRTTRVDSSTDTVGVSRRVKYLPNHPEYVIYVARWSEYRHKRTIQKTRSFACGNLRTEDEAYQSARDHRLKMVAKHYKTRIDKD